MHESRLFKIIYYLLEKGQATAPELASKFEVSVRTIYRDIDVMSSAGIPVYAAAGRDGGIKLYDDFIISKALLPEDMEVLCEIELRFPLNMGHRVLDIFSEEALIQNDKQIVVKASLPRNEWLYEMLLSFGENVEIVHPISLKEEIIERCEKALNHHKGAGL